MQPWTPVEDRCRRAGNDTACWVSLASLAPLGRWSGAGGLYSAFQLWDPQWRASLLLSKKPGHWRQPLPQTPPPPGSPPSWLEELNDFQGIRAGDQALGSGMDGPCDLGSVTCLLFWVAERTLHPASFQVLGVRWVCRWMQVNLGWALRATQGHAEAKAGRATGSSRERGRGDGNNPDPVCWDSGPPLPEHLLSAGTQKMSFPWFVNWERKVTLVIGIPALPGTFHEAKVGSVSKSSNSNTSTMDTKPKDTEGWCADPSRGAGNWALCMCVQIYSEFPIYPFPWHIPCDNLKFIL